MTILNDICKNCKHYEHVKFNEFNISSLFDNIDVIKMDDGNLLIVDKKITKIIDFLRNLSVNPSMYKAKRIDNDNWITGFFSKKNINNLIVPVIDVYIESDFGDYIESYQIDADTLINIDIENLFANTK